MSRRSLAFNPRDVGLAADLSRRSKKAADRLQLLQRHLPAGQHKRLAGIVGELTSIAAGLHPATMRFATYEKGRKCHVALIESRSKELYRLLPCAGARKLDIGQAQSVSRYAVKEWPTLNLAMAFARLETAHRAARHKVEDRLWGTMRKMDAKHEKAAAALQARAAKVKA